jgi:hypothetical protein
LWHSDWLQRFTLGLPSPNPVARVGATEQLLNPQRRPLRRPLGGARLLSHARSGGALFSPHAASRQLQRPGQQRAGAVRLGAARRAVSGAVRASSSRHLGPVRALVSEEAAAGERAAEGEGEDVEVRLFVGLPADAVVSDGRGVGCPRAVSAALRELKLLGVDGVELPVSWAVAQPGPGGWFEWVSGTAASLPWSATRGSTSASRSAPTATRSPDGWPTRRPPTPTSSSPTASATAAWVASPLPSTS